MNHPPAHPARPCRRGFALPMVVLLVVVASITSAIMLERQSATTLTVQRQLGAYHDHHNTRGLQEVIAAWTRTISGYRLEEAVGPDGHAFDLEEAGGNTVKVYVADAQGPALVDYTGLSGDDLRHARGIARALLEYAPSRAEQMRRDAPVLARDIGPVAVSLQHAPEQVIRAVSDYAITSTTADRNRFVSEILSRRLDKFLDDNDLTAISVQAGLSNEERTLVRRLLATDPTLWYVIVDVYEPRAGRSLPTPAVRYGGHILAQRAEDLRAQGSRPFDTNVPFLTWEHLELAGGR